MSPRKQAGQYKNSHPFVTKCAFFELKANFVKSDLLMYMHPRKISKHDAIITLRDFNAKLGKEQLYKDIIGRHSLHDVTKNNALRLVQYATTNSFKVLSTWFSRKGNWKIPGTNYSNKIDHILVSKMWDSDIRNILTYRGVNSDFDNILVEV